MEVGGDMTNIVAIEICIHCLFRPLLLENRMDNSYNKKYTEEKCGLYRSLCLLQKCDQHGWEEELYDNERVWRVTEKRTKWDANEATAAPNETRKIPRKIIKTLSKSPHTMDKSIVSVLLHCRFCVFNNIFIHFFRLLSISFCLPASTCYILHR